MKSVHQKRMVGLADGWALVVRALGVNRLRQKGIKVHTARASRRKDKERKAWRRCA